MDKGNGAVENINARLTDVEGYLGGGGSDSLGLSFPNLTVTTKKLVAAGTEVEAALDVVQHGLHLTKEK
eukprot:11657570-Ditylum_brightwellii.AAC.1